MESAVTLEHYIALSAALFFIGFAGVALNRRNALVLLMALELMLLACVLSFASFAHYGSGVGGIVFAMIALAVCAAETAIGLAILVMAYRSRANVETESFSELKE